MTVVATGTGYGRVTKVLHWTTFAALVAQLVVGYLLHVDDGGHGRGRGRGRGEGPGRGRGRGGEDGDGVLDQVVNGDDQLLRVHVLLGLGILLLAVVRVIWRRSTPLPPWAETLSPAERRLAHWTERVLYVVLFAVPLTGLGLVLVDDDLLVLHVASHITLYAAFTVHVGLVLKHQIVDRDRLLSRML